MRKLIASLFITVDGVVESPDKWQEHFDEDMLAELNAQLADQDAVLMGRVTYQEWADFWPNSSDEPFAIYINNAPKYVASTTLDSVAWGSYNQITLLEGSLVEAINRLKQQPGKNIGTAGSPTLVRALLENDLVDELRLLVHPVVVGSGQRLFEDSAALKRLKLVENKSSRTGTVILYYQPVKQA